MGFSKKAIFFISTLLLGACIQTSSEPPIIQTRVINAPPPTSVLSDDPPAQFDLALGADIYEQSCAPCHGGQGLGDGAAASGFSCPMPKLALYPPETNLTEWFEIVQNGKRSSDTCIMPPWNQRLSSQQMWQAVIYTASLRHNSNLLAVGESHLAEAQTALSSDYLGSITWQIGQTDADILEAITQNTLSGFDFSGKEVDQQAVLVAVRARMYAAPVQTEAAELAQPIQTEEAELAQNPTAEPIQTEEVQSPTNAAPSETFILSGKLINGTEGASLPADLPIILRVVAINDAGAPEEIYQREVTASAEQIFNFTDVPLNPRALAILETSYAGLRQRSPELFVGQITDDLYLYDFEVYETTTDPSGISILYAESLVDAVTAEGAALVFQNFEFINALDRIFLPNEAGYTLQIPLPKNASNATLEAFRSTVGRFQQVEENGQIVFYDTFPVYPNTPERLTLRYGMPYNGSMQVEQLFAYPVQSLGIYVSETRGLELESSQLNLIESGTLNNITYTGWGLNNLPANSTLAYRVLDGQRAQSAAPKEEEGSFVAENTTLILGFGVLLIILGGMFMIYDLQKTRLKAQTSLSREDILAAITALDADYEQGLLAENAYQKERQALKEQLGALQKAK